MNLREAILKEHSKAQTDKIVNYIGDDPLLFKELITLFLQDEYRVTQRAAWPLSNLSIKYPQLIKPYHLKLLTKIKHPHIHDAIKRNVLRIWAFTMPPEKIWAEAFDICYAYLHSKDEAIAIKACAMDVMCNVVKKYPELKFELKSAIEHTLPFSNPAIQSRGRKVLAAIEKMDLRSK